MNNFRIGEILHYAECVNSEQLLDQRRFYTDQKLYMIIFCLVFWILLLVHWKGVAFVYFFKFFVIVSLYNAAGNIPTKLVKTVNLY